MKTAVYINHDLLNRIKSDMVEDFLKQINSKENENEKND